MTPLSNIFKEGKAMFKMKYGQDPEQAYVSHHIRRAILRQLKARSSEEPIPPGMLVTFAGLEIFELGKTTAVPEIHMTKVVNGQRWVQKMNITPKLVPHGTVERLEGYEYDSLEEAEWLTSESELRDEVAEKLTGAKDDDSGKQN